MKNWFKASKGWRCALGLTLIFSLSSLGAGFKPTGHDELDAIRQSISSEKSNSENYELRLFMLKQWGCALQQMGANTEAILEVTEIYKKNSPWNLMHLGGEEKPLTPKQEKEMYPAIDTGYEILDAIYAECNQLTEEPVLAVKSVQTTDAVKKNPNVVYEDWPLYQKNNQHKGFSETDVVLQGKEPGRFPVGFAAYAQPVVEDGVVYAISPGMRTMMYSLDLETGKERWTTKQLADIVQDQLYWTPAAGSTPRIQKDQIIVRDIGSRGNKGDTRYAPMVADEQFIVFPHGPHDIHENPPIRGPFNHLICRDVKSGRKMWDMLTGASLCEPALKGNSVVTGNMNGRVFCFNLKAPNKGEKAGSVRWQFQASGGVNKSPIIENGNGDGTTPCFWKFRMENRMEEACMAFYGDKLYTLSSGGWVYAVV